jgi:hypothetical protein
MSDGMLNGVLAYLTTAAGVTNVTNVVKVAK